MTSFNPQRRAFLKGKITNEETALTDLRPPWAINETDFTQRCTRCAECINRCPEDIIEKGDGGFPVIDFHKGECTFCKECVDACSEAALILTDASTPWTLKASVEEHCLSRNGIHCMSCSDECELQAIHFQLNNQGISFPIVDETACTGCGACFRVCPVSAISISPAKHQTQHEFIQ